MTALFVCKTQALPAIVVSTDPGSWYDARRLTMMHFGCGPDECSVTTYKPNGLATDVELQWTGSDAGKHGGRVLRFRKRGVSGRMTSWAPIGEYEP